VKIETGRTLDAVDGFTIDSLHKQGFNAVFLGIGKHQSSGYMISASIVFARLLQRAAMLALQALY